MQNNEFETLLQAFQPGDLLYGLEKHARRLYRKQIEAKLASMQATYPYLTIDEYNNPLTEAIFSSNEQLMSPLQKLSTPIKNYGLSLLLDEKFRPGMAANLPTPERFDRRIILSCQFAILNCRGTIHFCLDGLKLNELRNPDCRVAYNSFTAQELRFIADNFESVKGKVKFYLGGKRVLSPWEAEQKTPDSWLMSYQAISLEAQKENKTTPIRDFGNRLNEALLFLSESPAVRAGFEITPDKPKRSNKRALDFYPHRDDEVQRDENATTLKHPRVIETLDTESEEHLESACSSFSCSP